MGRRASFEVVPYYAQVALIDASVPGSYPDWGDASKPVVFSPSGIAVATKPDWDPVSDALTKVRVEVWDSVPDSEAATIWSGSRDRRSCSGSSLEQPSRRNRGSTRPLRGLGYG
jgi:hypothetical protein